ncbi:MAG: hypothetical protein C0617_12720 [Desulfuromonas sp.]|uniref:hypothetical protein n=1 Tax=Desulfuromonas sp. TaxID=892 RepID=UPI000CA914A5|nr:hypothetical protein [Desulfuromonas sp.]PLX83376.1 MAG: hypothetical protein C0617_12720 [Desulfuromonas sp.]
MIVAETTRCMAIVDHSMKIVQRKRVGHADFLWDATAQALASFREEIAGFDFIPTAWTGPGGASPLLRRC